MAKSSVTRISSVASELPSSPSLADVNCCIQGTCLSKASMLGLFSSVEIGFDIRVDEPTRSWVKRCTLKDVAKLHETLNEKIVDESFREELSLLACPKQPLFKRRDMMVIKGLCVDLDHYIDELLKLCQRFTAAKAKHENESMIVESSLREFLAAPI
ncbi:unnamed protein product [Aphanomyces euteiches]|uniref:PX domain-containing protein n=1 Tax=Aphanomyces euteiches TaxID=100861 RepID=A0A6G0WTI2_9STRA|nr:hypothetical protein Ae201684_011854 [Aphanomyces euteiches]KAH9089334.1 hypothetical protein Ae201684P_001534 [Aphanomyces euteiches]KAH9133038.1 hypothetical protein AeRB84_020774 [Aphanomyces euteiches]